MLPAIADTINKAGGRGEGERAARHKGSVSLHRPQASLPQDPLWFPPHGGKVVLLETPLMGSSASQIPQMLVSNTHSVGPRVFSTEQAGGCQPPSPPCTRAGVGPGWLQSSSSPQEREGRGVASNSLRQKDRNGEGSFAG